MKRHILRSAPLACVLVLGLTFAPRAESAVLIVFGQTGDTGPTPISAVQAGGTTTITGADVPIEITQLGPIFNADISAFLNLTATNSGPINPQPLPDFTQTYSGSFSITSLAGGGGTNYLSGTFTDLILSKVGDSSLTISASTPPPTQVTFTSSVFTSASLGLPRGLTFGFVDISPVIAIENSTIDDFVAAVAGNMSASEPGEAQFVPEPASLAVWGGLSVLGLVFGRRRFAKKTA